MGNRKILRYGLLINSSDLQTWEIAMIRKLESEGLARCVLLLVNSAHAPKRKCTHFLYRLYRKIDRILFMSGEDAFSTASIFSVLDRDIPQISIKTKKVKNREHVAAEDIQQIQSFQTDILIRLGFGILSGDILHACPMGIWSMHHGDPAEFRGGPPAFWEVMRQAPLTGGMIQQLTEDLDGGQVLDKFWTQTDPLSVQRNANKLFWLSADRMARMIRLKLLHPKRFEDESIQNDLYPKYGKLYKKPGNLSMIGLGWILFQRNMFRKIRESWSKPEWRIWITESNTGDRFLTKWDEHIPMPLEKGAYQADPFLVQKSGQTYCFFERFVHRNKKGEIAFRTFHQGTWSASHTVIQEDFHLSYPFIFKYKEKYLMLTESAAAGGIMVYTAADFPYQWTKKAKWLSGACYDPTLVYKDGLYWLFVIRPSYPAGSPFDELCLYYTHDLEEAAWTAHPLNPIITDPIGGRPAGNIFRKDGKWYRPAQYSEKRYGQGLMVKAIIDWDTENYWEEGAGQLMGEDLGDFMGMHTFNQEGKYMVWDTFNRK
jgi:hypothetical protein